MAQDTIECRGSMTYSPEDFADLERLRIKFENARGSMMAHAVRDATAAGWITAARAEEILTRFGHVYEDAPR